MWKAIKRRVRHRPTPGVREASRSDTRGMVAVVLGLRSRQCRHDERSPNRVVGVRACGPWNRLRLGPTADCRPLSRSIETPRSSTSEARTTNPGDVDTPPPRGWSDRGRHRNGHALARPIVSAESRPVSESRRTPSAGGRSADALTRSLRDGMDAYARFWAMTATSTVAMLGLMYLNTYQLDHIFFSETRAYMALLMGAAMALIMLSFMLRMYNNRQLNLGIAVGSIVLFVAALWLVRSQATIEDVAYMKAMIPHHSIAILTSERARISDPRVRDLANRIISAQRNEIDEMKALIAEIGSGP